MKSAKHPNDCNHPEESFAGVYVNRLQNIHDVYFYKNDDGEWSSCVRYGTEGEYATAPVLHHAELAVSEVNSYQRDESKAIYSMLIKFANKNFKELT